MSWRFNPCNPCCACCLGDAPNKITVQVSGVVATPPNPITGFQCTGCPNLNGTYVLNAAPPDVNGNCIWSITGLSKSVCPSPEIVTLTGFTLAIAKNGLLVSLAPVLSLAGNPGLWAKSLTSQCQYGNLVNLVLPVSNTGAFCDLSASSAKITATA